MNYNIPFARAGLTSVGLVATLPLSALAGALLGPPILFFKFPQRFVVLAAPLMLVSPNTTIATAAIVSGLVSSGYLAKQACLYQQMDHLSKKATYSGVMIGTATMAAVSLSNLRMAYPAGCLVAGLVTCATLHLLIEKQKKS